MVLIMSGGCIQSIAHTINDELQLIRESACTYVLPIQISLMSTRRITYWLLLLSVIDTEGKKFVCVCVWIIHNVFINVQQLFNAMSSSKYTIRTFYFYQTVLLYIFFSPQLFKADFHKRFPTTHSLLALKGSVGFSTLIVQRRFETLLRVAVRFASKSSLDSLANIYKKCLFSSSSQYLDNLMRSQRKDSQFINCLKCIFMGDSQNNKQMNVWEVKWKK